MDRGSRIYKSWGWPKRKRECLIRRRQNMEKRNSLSFFIYPKIDIPRLHFFPMCSETVLSIAPLKSKIITSEYIKLFRPKGGPESYKKIHCLKICLLPLYWNSDSIFQNSSIEGFVYTNILLMEWICLLK